ncbi:MAG: hypothetical protein WC551_02895 [Patescibacteria group bacterium]
MKAFILKYGNAHHTYDAVFLAETREELDRLLVDNRIESRQMLESGRSSYEIKLISELPVEPGLIYRGTTVKHDFLPPELREAATPLSMKAEGELKAFVFTHHKPTTKCDCVVLAGSVEELARILADNDISESEVVGLVEAPLESTLVYHEPLRMH